MWKYYLSFCLEDSWRRETELLWKPVHSLRGISSNVQGKVRKRYHPVILFSGVYLCIWQRQYALIFVNFRITEEEFVKEWENICFGDEVRKKQLPTDLGSVLKITVSNNWKIFPKIYLKKRLCNSTAKTFFSTLNDDSSIQTFYNVWRATKFKSHFS